MAKTPLRDRQPRAFLTKRLDTLTIVRGIPKDQTRAFLVQR
jgi:hypothetical protein